MTAPRRETAQQSLRFQPAARIGLLVLCGRARGGRVGEGGWVREGEAVGEGEDGFGCHSLTFTLLVLFVSPEESDSVDVGSNLFRGCVNKLDLGQDEMLKWRPTQPHHDVGVPSLCWRHQFSYHHITGRTRVE